MRPGDQRKHLSSHRDRTQAAAIASGLLVSGRRWDPVIAQALEAVMFQRDARLDVLAWAKRIQREESNQ